MSRLKTIQDVNNAEVSLIRNQSELLLQKKKFGQNGELKTSGYLIENYVKELIKKNMPENYRVCSGYIATTETINSSDNLLQHDLIIVDNRIPSLYKFGVSDIEIVSAESVCAVIEIKRTLNKKIINEAVTHLKKTYDILEKYDSGIKSKLSKNDIMSSQLTPSTHAPFYAIIGLDCTPISGKTLVKLESVIDENVIEFIDMIWAISSDFLYYFGIKANGVDVTPTFVSRTPREGDFICLKESKGKSNNPGKVYWFAIALLRTWISNCVGSPLNENKNHKYFQSSD